VQKMAEKIKEPDWVMLPCDKEKAQGVYLTLETIDYEKKPLNYQ
jgi:hypothetical protein